MKLYIQYREKKQQLADQARSLINEGCKLTLGKKTSNLFRSHSIPDKHLDVSKFNQVIHIDPQALVADVEGMTTYDSLVKETLKFNCLPTVVPQLKTITIGGALTGIGIEASSFRYGLVHETILEFDVLLGDGRVVTCSPENEYSDLFFAFPNSYGSLGYALRVKVQLIPVKKYVKLSYLHFSDPEQFFQQLKQLCFVHRRNGSVAYIDGVAFAKNDLVITLGEFCEEAPYVSDYSYMKIYYRSIQQKTQDFLSVYDYIWRWDTDWFWCSSHFGMQNKALRFLFGKFLLNSKSYWKMMSFAQRNPFLRFLRNKVGSRSESIIQDVLIPIDRSVEFHEFFHREIGITPIWICPTQNYRENAKYSFWDTPGNTLLIDFGFWDRIATQHPEGHFNRLIEEKVSDLQGIKSLYSDVYYTQEQFWSLYNRPLYESLKRKYDPNNAFKPLFDKVSEH